MIRMSDSASTFQYSVVRIVPDVVRDEAVNVGVIVRIPGTSTFGMRFLGRDALARRLRPGADRGLLRHFEAQLSRYSTSSQLALDPDGNAPGFGDPRDPEFFEIARAQLNGNIQLTVPSALVVGSLEDAVAWAFERFVADKGTTRHVRAAPALAPSKMRAQLVSRFARSRLIGPGKLNQQVVLAGAHASWSFDLGYVNGATHVINSLAFSSQHRETNLGRALVLKGMIEDVQQSQALSCVAVVNPQASAFPGAKDAASLLAEASIEVLAFDQLESLAERVRADLELHSVGG